MYIILCLLSLVYILYFAEKRENEIGIGSESIFKSDSEAVNLMSENYLEGKSVNAYNINCSVEPDSQSLMSMTVKIHEFSPFINTSDYCMYLNDAKEELACSGSKNLSVYQETFESSSGWKFSMTLADSAEYEPEIRFWITIACE